MELIKELFRIGVGPSSSHTMGPHLAAEIFSGQRSEATFFKVTLFGSLAAAGRGNLTDAALKSVFAPIMPFSPMAATGFRMTKWSPSCAKPVMRCLRSIAKLPQGVWPRLIDAASDKKPYLALET